MKCNWTFEGASHAIIAGTIALSRTLIAGAPSKWLGTVLDQRCESIDIGRELAAIAATHAQLEHRHNQLGCAWLGGVGLINPCITMLSPQGRLSLNATATWTEPCFGTAKVFLSTTLGISGWTAELEGLEVQAGECDGWLHEAANSAFEAAPEVLTAVSEGIAQYNQLRMMNAGNSVTAALVNFEAAAIAGDKLGWRALAEWFHPLCPLLHARAALQVANWGDQWQAEVTEQQLMPIDTKQGMIKLWALPAARDAVCKVMRDADFTGLRETIYRDIQPIALHAGDVELGHGVQMSSSSGPITVFEGELQVQWSCPIADGTTTVKLQCTSIGWFATLLAVEIRHQQAALANKSLCKLLTLREALVKSLDEYVGATGSHEHEILHTKLITEHGQLTWEIGLGWVHPCCEVLVCSSTAAVQMHESGIWRIELQNSLPKPAAIKSCIVTLGEELGIFTIGFRRANKLGVESLQQVKVVNIQIVDLNLVKNASGACKWIAFVIAFTWGDDQVEGTAQSQINKVDDVWYSERLEIDVITDGADNAVSLLRGDSSVCEVLARTLAEHNGLDSISQSALTAAFAVSGISNELRWVVDVGWTHPMWPAAECSATLELWKEQDGWHAKVLSERSTNCELENAVELLRSDPDVMTVVKAYLEQFNQLGFGLLCDVAVISSVDSFDVALHAGAEGWVQASGVLVEWSNNRLGVHGTALMNLQKADNWSADDSTLQEVHLPTAVAAVIALVQSAPLGACMVKASTQHNHLKGFEIHGSSARSRTH